jgi:hypothetical protein
LPFDVESLSESTDCIPSLSTCRIIQTSAASELGRKCDRITELDLDLTVIELSKVRFQVLDDLFAFLFRQIGKPATNPLQIARL